MNERILNASKDISKLAKEYEIMAENSEGHLKTAYQNFTDELDELHSKILGIGKYADEEELEIDAVVTKTYGELPIYSKVDILHKYNDGNALVMDTAYGFHLVDISDLRLNEDE